MMGRSMVLLLVVAVIAGAGTAITPCVLPVLPALLSASATGGRRRPVGIVIGLGVTFTIAIVAVAKLVDGVGLAGGATRDIAIVVLIGFGLVMMIPELAQRIQAPLSRLARFGPKTRGDGFVSGIAVGAALGFVCAPCAGPILGAVTAVSASTGPTFRIVLLGIAYSAGLAAMLLLWAFGGRAVTDRIRRHARGHIVERVLGAVLLLTGVAMVFNLDVRFEDVLANNVPSFIQDPSSGLESSHAVQNGLGSLRPESRFAKRQAAADGAELPDLGKAPNFTDTQQWFNTPGDKPLSIAELHGHVVLVDFWTYTCINCIRTVPFVEGLYKRYHRYGLDVVGVETPEFTFEQIASNVDQAIKTDGITYPVVQDNHYGTWNAYQNEYWPAEYYIDASGEVRHTHFGEGDYAKDEHVVRQLLRAAGARHLPPTLSTGYVPTPSRALGTPETYLNPQRQQGFYQQLTNGTANYRAPTSLDLNNWALHGRWTVGSQSITPAAGAAAGSDSISGHVEARDVYLVMTSDGNEPRRGQLLINGHVPTPAERGSNVGPGGYFTVRGEHLYNLVKLGTDRNFTITVRIPAGIHAYDFTFG
jgi:cytochrome c biogenesis protein CcdA/thiol-disulfide isomerase/thioredoxin